MWFHFATILGSDVKYRPGTTAGVFVCGRGVEWSVERFEIISTRKGERILYFGFDLKMPTLIVRQL